MLRLFALPLAAALAVGLGACSSGEGASSGEPELLIWVDTIREPAARMYAASVEGEVDVTIEVVDVLDLQPKISLFNTTGKGWPDVVFAEPNDVAAWADPSNGYAANLSDYVDPAIFDGYNGSNDWCMIDGSYYCLKNDLAQTVLWYDTVLFDEFGLEVPTTMDEFAEEALKLAGTGYTAGAIGDQGYYAGYLWPSGCPMSTVIDPSTLRIDPDAVECTRVADLVQPLVDAGVLDTRSAFDAGFINDVAKAGKVAMHIGPSWWGEFVIRPSDSWAIPSGRIAAAPMPKWSGNDEAYSGEWGGGIWLASAHSQFPQEAADAAVYMATSLDVMKEAVTFPGYQPAYEVWAARISADPYYASDIIPALVQQASLINPSEKPVRFANNTQIGAVLQTELNAGTDVATATRQFQEALIQLAPSVGYKVVQ